MLAIVDVMGRLSARWLNVPFNLWIGLPAVKACIVTPLQQLNKLADSPIQGIVAERNDVSG